MCSAARKGTESPCFKTLSAFSQSTVCFVNKVCFFEFFLAVVFIVSAVKLEHQNVDHMFIPYHVVALINLLEILTHLKVDFNMFIPNHVVALIDSLEILT